MNRIYTVAAMIALVGAVSSPSRAATIGAQEPAGYSARLDGTSDDYIFDSIPDAAGNVIVVGRSRSVELNVDVFGDRTDAGSDMRPGQTSHDVLVAHPNGGGFVIKYDREGKIVWKRFAGNKATDSITGVTVDSSGNVYITGTFGGLTGISFGGITLIPSARSNVTFNNTLDPNQTSPAQNVFVAMLDTNGNWIWARQFEYAVFGTDTSVVTPSAANPGGEVNAAPTITTDAGALATRPVMDGNGHTILRDNDGNLFLKMRLYNTSIVTPTNNRVYWIRTAGTDTGQVPATLVTGGGGQIAYDTVFVAKLGATPPVAGSPAGTPTTYDWRWIAPMNSDVPFKPNKEITAIGAVPKTASISGMALDFNDSLYVTGAWSGNLVGAGMQPPVTAATAADGYVVRLRTLDAGAIWFARFRSEGGGGSFGGGLVLDEQRNVFVTGAATNTTTLKLVDADPTSFTTRSFTADSAARTAFFIGKINQGGHWLWSEAPDVTATSGDFTARLTTMTRDAAGALYVGGALRATANSATIAFPLPNPPPNPPPLINPNPVVASSGTEAFVARLTEDTGAATRSWEWTLQTTGKVGMASGVLDTGDVRAGTGGTLYWSVNALPALTTDMTRFVDSRSPNSADQAFDTVQGQGAFLLPIRFDVPALSPQFSITNSVICGQEVRPPSGANHFVQPEITLPALNNAPDTNHFYWDSFAARLYAVYPVRADIKWIVTNASDPQRIKQRVDSVWPTPADGLITHVTGAGPNGDEPKVSVQPDSISSSTTFATILYTENQAVITGNKQFSTKSPGFSVLLYVNSANAAPGQAPVSLDVVRSYIWNDPAVKDPVDTAAVIGTEITNPFGLFTDPSGKNGYIVNAKARFDGSTPDAAYNRATQVGSIIPVNTDEPGDDDDMIIIWSKLQGGLLSNPPVPRGVAWPIISKKYVCSWPPSAPETTIVIASQRGSETDPNAELLNPTKFQSISIYHQPNKNLAGYNPNEEHALLEPSNTGSGFNAVFALRNDLNNLGITTSDPYVLLRYHDGLDGLKTKFKVYKVERESATYKFTTFTGTAGTPVQPPYPLSLLPGAAGTTGSGAAYFKDRFNAVWAKCGGIGGGVAIAGVVANYFYPLRPDFWYDVNHDTVQDSDTDVPWLDRVPGGTVGKPIDVKYDISWPAVVAELAIGDTLSTNKGRTGPYPDVEHMLSASIIFEESNQDPNASPFTGSARIIDFKTERAVPLDGVVNGQNLIVGSNSFAVEATNNGRYVFQDLPFHLKSRLSFDPLEKKLILGGYEETSDVGEPFLLLNVLSPVELARLKTFPGPAPDLKWTMAIDALFNLSRNPYVVNGIAGGYYLGLQKSQVGQITRLDASPPLAIITGRATGFGFVTLVENNKAGLPNSAPVALHILKVVSPSVVGAVKVLRNDNVFDEKVSLRHRNDFAGAPCVQSSPFDVMAPCAAGNTNNLHFQWFYQPANTATSPPLPDTNNPGVNDGWQLLKEGDGLNDVVIEGAGLTTLTDSWVVCRYKGYLPDKNAYTAWAGDPAGGGAAFVAGWIKRVIGKVNGFDQAVPFASAPAQTYSSFIAQAGEPFSGPVALNDDATNLNSIGLISLYQTVLNRGLDLSINGTPPVTASPAISNALLLASTRISDLYMLLGNEAYADAQDPTIGFTSADKDVGTLAPSVFAFANQVPNLISEELALLRGRDDSSAGVRGAPVYNRLFWNFTGGLEGQPVYVQNYGITDQNADAHTDATDARILFPQGHGDAWGHYLSAVKTSYRLLRHPRFEWFARAETTTVAGVAIEVDYLDEIKFARAAAARAKAGSEIVNLTYRDNYVADPAGQWQGYKDTDTTRAWGVDEWARRAGQGAFFDWVTANAILPANHTKLLGTQGDPHPTRTPSGLEKIDRTTVTELAEIASAFAKVQAQMDQADQGLNPLGVTPGSIPFDIDPAFLIIGSGIQGKKHFEQIYERTTAAVKNARQVFDYANGLTLRLRQTQISADDFAQDSLEQEMDYKNRLIEIYGYPYDGDIGPQPAHAYPTGYDGPDIHHWMYVAVNDVSGTTIQPDTARTALLAPFPAGYTLDGQGNLNQAVGHYFPGDVIEPAATAQAPLPLLFPLARAADWTFVAPPEWGSRRAPGTLQMAISDVVRAEAELRHGLVDYNNHIAQIKDELDLLKARNGLANNQIKILDTRNNTLKDMNQQIAILQGISVASATLADISDHLFDAASELCGTDVLKAPVKFVGAAAFGILSGVSAGTEIAANVTDLAKESVSNTADLEIVKSDFTFDIQERLKSIEALLRDEVGMRLDLFNLREALRSSVGNFSSILAEGKRLEAERLVYRQKVGGAVEQNRYQDITFRLFRNDALQKYRAAFDLAARYTYLAATTYDYETCQLGTSTASGRRFLTDIVRQRALGGFFDDDPIAGVNGLSDPLARLNQNYQVLKTQLGINNPQLETGRFSLRHELFRLRDETNEKWQDQLQKARVDDLWKVPEFRRFCRPFAPESAGPQPGLVITFSTDITFGQNFFGLPLGGGDSSYDSSNFATKINSAGVWFKGYNGKGLSATPRVYLIPVGLDIMRPPNDPNLGTREFDVVDQAIPVPFPVGGNDLANPNWIPQDNSLSGPIGQIRQFNRFRAYNDSDPEGNAVETSELVTDTRLVGRSVWNKKWMLIIPGGTFLNDPKEGLDTLILGEKMPNSTARDGHGITDIKLFFETYSYSGN